MDSIHDLGGKQGFGRIDTDEPEDESFHSDWEARTYGMVQAMTRAPDWNVDWFRFCRELIPPTDYLSRPYYDQWLQAYTAMMLNTGVVTMEEIVNGRADGPLAGIKPPMTAQFVRETGRKLARNAERPGTATPRFAEGDKVATMPLCPRWHTRLPAYLRGRPGIVTAYRGLHVLPDANAFNDERAEPLYTVGFAASDLWPEAKDSPDRIHADLWESYLEPA